MALFSFLLPLLLLFQSAAAPRQTTPAPAAKPAKETLGWSANRPLTWADFKARPMGTDRLKALTSANIDVQVACKDFVFSSTVTAVFLPQESWVQDAGKASANLLRHEQLHFDITELHARLLRQKLSTIKLDCQHLNPAFSTLTKNYFAAWQREETRYDVESNHGLNQEKQQFWETQVKQRLALLESFASR
jgi:hypothetical protein